MKISLLILPIVILSTSLLADDNKINVYDTSSLSVTSEIKSNDNKILSIIKVPTLLADDGRPAKGKQNILFFLDKNAPQAVRINNKTVSPGSSIELNISANDIGGLDIPIHPTELGKVGDSLFTITLNEIKVISCPSGYELSSNESYCYTYSYKKIDNYSCNGKSGYNYFTSTGKSYGSEDEICYARIGFSENKSYTCKSGYTKNKWTKGHCTDSSAYITSVSNKESCEASGGNFGWDGVHYVCTFLSPSEYRIPQVCNGTVMGNLCYDKSNTGRATVVNCPSGYSYSPSTRNCSRMITRNPI